MAKERYNAESITVLKGLDPVRKRPGMYIGNTSTYGLHHIVWEIVDNSIDEAANKFANKVDLTLNEDGSVTVEDNGSGIPVDIHPEAKIPAVELVFTKLHAGGKFNNKNYSFAGGLHGVGASVTNALCEWLNVEVYRDGSVYREEFYSPEMNGEVYSGIVKTPLKKIGKTNKKGTKVTFMPDKRVFDSIKYDPEMMENKMRELAFLNKGVKTTFTNNRDENPSTMEFYY